MVLYSPSVVRGSVYLPVLGGIRLSRRCRAVIVVPAIARKIGQALVGYVATMVNSEAGIPCSYGSIGGAWFDDSVLSGKIALPLPTIRPLPGESRRLFRRSLASGSFPLYVFFYRVIANTKDPFAGCNP